MLQLPAIFPLLFRLETTGKFHLPTYAGALFRGGFGQFFRDLVCVTKESTCTGCPHLRDCAYSLLFESPVDTARSSVLRKYPNAPHPFVMVPRLDERRVLSRGEAIPLEVTLIGEGVHYLPHFIHILERLGMSGRYGGSFRVKGVDSAVGGGVVYDGTIRRMVAAPTSWTEPVENGPVKRMRIGFLTPLRMRTGGQYNQAPNFVALSQALLRRVHLLSALYGTGAGTSEWMHELLSQADAVRIEEARYRPFAWDRMSGKQGRRVSMDGVLGGLTAIGELTALAPYYRFGEWINLGSGTSMGLGKYVLECGS